MDWDSFRPILSRMYRGRARRGRPPYDPVVMFKVLVLVYLYGLSERQVELFVNDSLSVKCFLGLTVDEARPDHSSLTKLRKRIEENGQQGLLQELLVAVIQMAREQGVEFGEIQVVDSSHTEPNVDVAKDDRRRREGKPRRDRGARWGAKGKRRRRRKEKPEPRYF